MTTELKPHLPPRPSQPILLIAVLLAVLGGYVYLAWQSHGQNQELSTKLQSIRDDIVKEVTVERERRLEELHTVVKTEQKRQDAVTADIAQKADQRAAVAETKAEIARKKTEKIEKRTKTVEKILNIVPNVPIIVPTPEPFTAVTPTPHPCGLFNAFRCDP
jgi:predicted negative regulator of RcsB-dependent stress response